MADYSVFSNLEFSSTAWINSVINDSEGMSIDAVLSTVTTKLHIMSQDYSDQLETSMVESMSTMPRLLSEISKIEDQLRSTENEMKKLSAEIVNFDQRNVSGVEDLSRLDLMKSNIERCKSTLEEHARWSVLVREAKSQLESGTNRAQTADRIESMFRSLSILKKLPGHDARLASCNALRDALLSSLRPTIQRDIASADLLTLKEYLYIFQKLDCNVEFEREYVASRSTPFLQMWSKLPTATGDVAQWLASNLGRITRLISDEESPVSEIFGAANGKKILQDIAITSTAPMHATLNQLLTTLDSPAVSFDCYCVVDEFSRRLIKSLEGLSSDNQLELIAFIFSGLLEFLPVYVDSENSFLRAQFESLLNSVSFGGNAKAVTTAAAAAAVAGGNAEDLDDLLFSSDDDPTDALNGYLDRLTALSETFVDALSGVVERSVKFAGGAKVKQVLRCVMSHLSWLTKQLAVKIAELGVACGVQSDVLNELSGGAEKSKSSNVLSKLDFQVVENRVLITCALRSVQAAGIYLRKFQEFESFVKSLLGELTSVLLNVETMDNHSYAYKLLLMDASATSELKSFLLVATSPTSPSAAQNMFASATALPLEKLQLAACTLLFNLSLTFPLKVVTSSSLEDSWSLTGDVHADSILPQSVVIQVGEHLLLLVQEFEAFATSDALTDVLYVVTSVSAVAEKSQGWQAFFTTCQLADVSLHNSLANRDLCSQLVTVISKVLNASLPDLDFEQDHTNDATDEGNTAVLKFVNEWLGAIASAVVALFLVQVVHCKSLTPSGIVQLLTDMSYLSNVINAMGIKPHPLLGHVIKLLGHSEHAPALANSLQNSLTQQGSHKAVQFLVHFDQKIVEKIQAGVVKKQ